jgi:hypothetical protein
VKFIAVDPSPTADQLMKPELLGTALSSTETAYLNPLSSCYDELQALPYYICEDLIAIWVGFIQHGIRYHAGQEPIWWPEKIPFKRPQCLRKFGMLLSLHQRPFADNKKRRSIFW